MIEAGYTLTTRTTSQTLDMLRTALDLTDLAPDTPRFGLFYRLRQKVWDSRARPARHGLRRQRGVRGGRHGLS
ncbi:hypothetical protein [Micromonospora sp. LOL_024]|uniref:hypothetical protein n=1 Tax=Micromonospora sp. LOL_024 TaxID=3345412 RepID=UPI003A85DBF7